MSKSNTSNINEIEEAEQVDDTLIELDKITKINSYIYLGSYEHSYMETDDFKALNINVIINCCSSQVHYPNNLREKYIIEDFAFDDDIYASLLDYIDEVDNTIYNFEKMKKNIYIHCVKGVSRSPAIIIYFLMMHRKKSYSEALKIIKRKRPIININLNFKSELKQMEDSCCELYNISTNTKTKLITNPNTNPNV